MTKDEICKLALSCFQGNPTLVLGSGASASFGLPSMDSLRDHLLAEIVPEGEAENDNWLLVRTALGNGDHLERALEGKNLPASLVAKIVKATWVCVNAKDHSVFQSITANAANFPLGSLLHALFQSSNTTLSIITTNYDRIIEYSCDSVGLYCQTGFTPGYFQHWAGDTTLGLLIGKQRARTVRLWKVHGSLDWFLQPDGRTIGMPTFELPTGALIPQIVTPGSNKYQTALQDPFRSTISGADKALMAASAFLCLGYGFRDEHIHPKIHQRCRDANVPTVVLAKSLTEEAKQFLRTRAGVNYLGIEESGNGSRVFSSKSPNGIEVAEPGMWSLEGFQKLAT